MRIIPVIDLRGGRAVRGRGGDRRAYRPVRSVLRTGASGDLSDPVELAEIYRDSLDAELLYIADLDAIEGTGNNGATIRTLLRAAPEMRILLDAGRVDLAGTLSRGLRLRIEPVLATETLDAIPTAAPGRRPAGPVLGIDLGRDRVIARSADLAACDEIDLLREARRRGMRRAILLLLDRVGTSGGLPRERLSRLRDAVVDIELMAGGGIAGLEDLNYLKARGFSGALVATALHDGRLAPEELRSAGFIATP